MNFSTPWLESPGLKSSWLKSLGLKGPGLKLGVEKSGVEMSFNPIVDIGKKVICKPKRLAFLPTAKSH